MNKIDISQITDPGVQQPFTGPSLDFLQTAIKEIIAALGDGLAPIEGFSSSIPYTIFDCNNTAGIVNNGYILFNGEIYAFTGDDTTGYSNVPVVVTDNSNGGPDPVVFSDGTSKNVHNVRKIKLVDALSGSGLFDYSALIYLQTQVKPLAVLNSWINASFSPECKLRMGMVSLRGNVTKTPLDNTVIFTLPLEMRPTNLKTIPCVVTAGGSLLASILFIASNGNVTVQAVGSGVSVVYFDGISFYKNW